MFRDSSMELKEVLRKVKGPVTIVLGDAFCSEGFIPWVEGLGGDPCRESDEDALKRVKKLADLELDTLCIVTVCVDEIHRKVFGRALVELYGSCRRGLSRELPKHSVDEFLKCIAASETVLALCLTRPLSVVSEALVVASAMGKDIVVVSTRLPEGLEGLRNFTFVKVPTCDLKDLEL